MATRLRQEKLFSKRLRVIISLKSTHIQYQTDYIQPTNDEKLYYTTAQQALSQWQGQGVFKISIHAEKLTNHSHYQRDLFEPCKTEHDRINALKDQLNERFGDGTLKAAKLLLSPQLSEVIPPSWKPQGPGNCVKSQAKQQGHRKKN